MKFGALIGGAACPGPTGVVHVVGLVGADGVESAEFLQCGEML